MKPHPAELLGTWLERRLSASDWLWLQSRLSLVSVDNSNRDLHITLGLIPRKLGRDDLALNKQEIAQASQVRKGWDPTQWSIDTAARLLVLCTTASRDEATFGATIKDLCQTADLAEAIAYYTGFPLYPHSPALDYQIGEGLRTNMRAVFEAIAHRSPYPQEHFDENRWNHMVLKALFVDSTLAPIQGIDERSNPGLARILCDYAHERWAANRPVTPELWRCVGPHASGTMLEDLVKVAESENSVERHAALIALSQCPDQSAIAVLKKFPAVTVSIASGELTWDSLGADNAQ